MKFFHTKPTKTLHITKIKEEHNKMENYENAQHTIYLRDNLYSKVYRGILRFKCDMRNFAYNYRYVTLKNITFGLIMYHYR